MPTQQLTYAQTTGIGTPVGTSEVMWLVPCDLGGIVTRARPSKALQSRIVPSDQQFSAFVVQGLISMY